MQLEYVWCMDTMNREKCNGDQLLSNPTNDVKIRPQLSVNRLSVNAIELATLELPRVQRLIEPEWSRVYTYDGFVVQGDNSLVISDGKYTYTAYLPYTFNQVVTISPGSQITVVTTEDHLLEQSIPIYEEAMQTITFVGMSTVTPTFTPDPLDEKKFTVTFSSTPVWEEKISELYHPPLPSPEFVALAIDKSINRSFREQTGATYDAFKVTFDTTRSRFRIKIHSDAARTVVSLKNAKILSGGLVRALGFNNGVPLFNQSDSDYAAIATDLPYGTKYVQLNAGDYTSTQLAAEIERASNTTYFPPSPTGYKLSIGIDGTIYPYIVPEGMYTPVTLAATLKALLDPQNVDVEWHATDAVYTFSATFLFSLEFTPEHTNIANQLGFNPFRYSCATEYESRFYTNPQAVRGSNAYGTTVCQVEDDISAQKMTFYVSRASTNQNFTFTANTTAANELEVTGTAAHGYQEDDVVLVTIPTNGTNYLLKVIEASTGTTFKARCPSSLPTPGNLVAQFPTGPTTSVFVSLNNERAIKPSIIGFGNYDRMWSGTQSVQSPFTYRLQASTYILLEMVYPGGSTLIEHRNGSDNRTAILGKIVTLADPFLDRFYPMKATFFSGIRLDYFQFRLLNPDHTLYKLHGHDWQATFRLCATDHPLN